LLKGDNNTEFFHRIANGRKRRQTLFSLQDGGTTVVGTENLLTRATAYYKSLFGPGNGNAFELESDLWDDDKQVSSEDNPGLVRPFEVEEVKRDLFDMEKNKAAGPDGFPIEFYQVCWDIIKEDIMDLFGDFFSGTLDIKRLNYGIITLLPKTK
jgi:hypothetical protein